MEWPALVRTLTRDKQGLGDAGRDGRAHFALCDTRETVTSPRPFAPMNARAEVGYLRWLLREVYPHIVGTMPPELLEYVEQQLLRVGYDHQGRAVTFSPGRYSTIDR